MPIQRKNIRTKRAQAVPPPAPPVDYDSTLAPWRSPQYVPSAPHRMPGKGPVIGSPLIGNSASDSTLPPSPPVTPTTDPHHYASVTGNLHVASNNASGQIAFLTQPATKRNWLTLRNTAAAGIIYVDFGQQASANSPIAVQPGQTILFDVVVPQDDLYAFGSVALLGLSFSYSNIPG